MLNRRGWRPPPSSNAAGLVARAKAYAAAKPFRALFLVSMLVAAGYVALVVREWQSIPKSLALLWRAYFWTDTVALRAAMARRWDGKEKRVQLALVLPVTSKGSEASLRARKREEVLVLAVFLKSLSSAVLSGKEGRIDYTVYLGVAADDAVMETAAQWVVDSAMSWLFQGLPITMKIVHYPGGQTLTEMYNHLSVAAYSDDVDYVFNVNDDLTVAFPFAEAMIRPLEHSLVAPGFGTAGLFEKWQGLDLKTRCPMYNMVSRVHLQAFDGLLYDDFFPNYGIDTAICHLYGTFDASFYVLDPHLVNHVNIDGSSQVPTRYVPGEYKIKSQYEARTALLKPALDSALAHYRAKGTFHGFACSRAGPAGFQCTSK